MIFLATSWKLILEPAKESSSAGERTVGGERRESQPDAVGAADADELELERDVQEVSKTSGRSER
jgi:hypothetical protein